MDFPQFPGEEVYSHAAALFLEKAEARLASLGLLAAAEGHPSEATKAIVDIDLDDLPALEPSHREYHRRHTDRTKIAAQNKANESKRFSITMAEWTTIFSLLKASTEETAPVLSRQLKDMCDLAITQGIAGGYFDGPRAWAMVKHKLAHGASRTEEDKDFYRSAEHTQRTHRLPDGCAATDYAKKALAFLMGKMTGS